VEKGDTVKIICKNGLIESGKLVKFEEDSLIIDQVEGTSLIILKPYDNVVGIKILSIKEMSRPISEVAVQEDLELKERIPQEQLRVKKLAELHMLRAQEERVRARELLSQHKPTNTLPGVQFGTPQFKKSISKHPKKKT
jgi:hypothetical protein